MTRWSGFLLKIRVGAAFRTHVLTSTAVFVGFWFCMVKVNFGLDEEKKRKKKCSLNLCWRRSWTPFVSKIVWFLTLLAALVERVELWMDEI